MPPEIEKLADSISSPKTVKVEVPRQQHGGDHRPAACSYVDKGNKNQLLVHLLEGTPSAKRWSSPAPSTARTRWCKELDRAGIEAEAIHGNKSQSARQSALKGFKDGKICVLVATDIAARGIDIDGLTHVINFDIPTSRRPTYHRIGRTGRAGASGKALSFCDHEEKAFLRDITKLIARQIPVVEDHPFPASGNASKPLPPEPPRGQGRQGGGRK
jgi:ATP-dependent RNA helicase RhlE